ncbi:MAG: hypothetical protein OXG36_14330 [Caldilineaceae bacterium]|nr:hypothetical protein [Caldilineaceae bacterium]
MYPEPTLPEQVEASLKVLGLRPVVPEEGAARLNKVGLADPQGNAWTPETLAAYLDEHNIRPEVLPDLSHLIPWNEGRSWTDPDRILRAIERGPDATADELRRVIKDDPEVRRAVIDICATVNDNPYQPGIYEEWLAFARQCN